MQYGWGPAVRLTAPQPKRASGFTMLELLVVSGIMLVLFGMVANGLSGMGRARRLRLSTDKVAGVIGLARSRAIADGVITHVRVENRGPDDQWISVYRFPRATDAMSASEESKVQELKGQGPAGQPGWNPTAVQGHYSNYLIERQKLEAGTYFETQYDPVSAGENRAPLWDVARGRPNSRTAIHGDPPSNLYCPRAPASDAPSLLPRVTPSFGLTGAMNPGVLAHALLSFYPDGTAAQNILLFIRDETSLQWVQVWRGGIIRTGDVQSLPGFTGITK